MKVYLDDERECPEGWVLVKTVPALIRLVQKGGVEEISLDHDLGEDEMTGYDFMKWLEAQVFLSGIKPPKIHFHTANPVGRKNMALVLESIERHGPEII